MVTPALRALRRLYPAARLLVQGRAHLFPLLDGAGLFDAAMPLVRGAGAGRANRRRLAAEQPELAVIFPHSFRAAWDMFRAGIPMRLGYAREGRSWLLTHALPPHRLRRRIVPVPMVLQYLELAGALGAVPDGDGPRLAIQPQVASRAAVRMARWGLSDNLRLVGLNPGASFGPSKVWPVEHMAALGDRFQQEAGTRVVLLGGPGEESLLREIEGRMRTRPINTAEALVPLDELKAVLGRCALLVSTDTGPRHIAVALGTPTVCLMGPTDPRYTASHLGPSVVLRRDVPCGPCHYKVCPIDHVCLRSIAPDEVFSASLALLAEHAPTAR